MDHQPDEEDVDKTLKYGSLRWELSSIKDMKCDSIRSSWMSPEGGQGI